MPSPSQSASFCPACLARVEAVVVSCPACESLRPEDGWGALYAEGSVFDRHYLVIRHLALGGGGQTFQARELDTNGEQTGPMLAIKVLYPGRETGSYLQRLATEARVLQELNHNNILECLGFVHRRGHPPYLVTHFESGGTLLEQINRFGPLPIRVVAGIGRQICWALSLAHQAGVIHRDMKPENILLANPTARDELPHVRVADFGVAKLAEVLGTARTRAGAFVGTPTYAAPEQLGAESPTTAADIFGLGAVLYLCATGRHAYSFAEHLGWEDRRDALVAALPVRLPATVRVLEGGDALEQALQAAMSADPAARPDAMGLDALLAGVISGTAALDDSEEPPLDRNTLLFELDAPSQPLPAVVRPAPAHAVWQPPKSMVQSAEFAVVDPQSPQVPRHPARRTAPTAGLVLIAIGAGGLITVMVGVFVLILWQLVG